MNEKLAGQVLAHAFYDELEKISQGVPAIGAPTIPAPPKMFGGVPIRAGGINPSQTPTLNPQGVKVTGNAPQKLTPSASTPSATPPAAPTMGQKALQAAGTSPINPVGGATKALQSTSAPK